MSYCVVMPEFRYSQFCPLARAAELLGERWTLLILRELSVGPQRFSDLRRKLGSVSSSVLTERLARLEARDLVRQRALAPPAASTVYELGDAGEAARPAMRELMRWGTRFLLPPVPGDQFEASWVAAACDSFASREATPARNFEIVMPDADHELTVRVGGGPEGTHPLAAAEAVDATVRGEALAVMAVIAGMVEPAAALSAGGIRVEGDVSAFAELPLLFDLPPGALSDSTQE